MVPKLKVYGITFQKHGESPSECCAKQSLVVCSNVAQAAEWANDNMPKGDGWTVSVSEVNQPVEVLI